MNELIDEIKEDIKQENLHKFWQKYGGLLIAGAIIIVLATAGGTLWKHLRVSNLENIALVYHQAEAALDKEQYTDAAELFESISREDSNEGYATLALLRLGYVYDKLGKKGEALAIYKRLVDSGDTANAISQMAELQSIFLTHTDMDEETLDNMLAPLIKPGTVWRGTALEFKGFFHYNLGNYAKAIAVWGEITNDITLPMAIRNRANEMLSVISNDSGIVEHVE